RASTAPPCSSAWGPTCPPGRRGNPRCPRSAAGWSWHPGPAPSAALPWPRGRATPLRIPRRARSSGEEQAIWVSWNSFLWFLEAEGGARDQGRDELLGLERSAHALAHDVVEQALVLTGHHASQGVLNDGLGDAAGDARIVLQQAAQLAGAVEGIAG